MSEQVVVSVKLTDSTLTEGMLDTIMKRLKSNLRGLYGMSNLLFKSLKRNRDGLESGLAMEVPSEKLEAVIRRIKNSFYRKEHEIDLVIQIRDVKIEITTQNFDEISRVLDIANKRFLFQPGYQYLTESMIYGLTRNEISTKDSESLSFLEESFNILPDQVRQIRSRTIGKYDTSSKKKDVFYTTIEAEANRFRSQLESDHSYEQQDVLPILKELAQNLGLPTLEAQNIWKNERNKVIKVVEERKVNAQRVAEQEIRNQQQRERTEKYRNICNEIIRQNFYLNAFEQGRLEQARLSLLIETNEALKIEESIRNEAYGDTRSAVGADYSRLRDLLAQKKWFDADQETEYLLLRWFSQDMKPLQEGDLQRLNFVDLKTISDLWSRYSSGRFGFQAQLNVYLSIRQKFTNEDSDSIYDDFYRSIEWQVRRSLFHYGFLSYTSLNFSFSAPIGHLPTWRWCCQNLERTYSINPFLTKEILSHFNLCWNKK